MSRLVHGGCRNERTDRYPCGALVLPTVYENGAVTQGGTTATAFAARITCEACKRALQQREAG